VHFATTLAVVLGVTWPQFGRDPGHTGSTPVRGQPLLAVAATVVIDPFADIERAFSSNDLYVHYAVPLIDGDDVFVEIKGGTYTQNDWSTQTWGVQAFRWRGSVLTRRWTTMGDWTPVPFAGGVVGPEFEPLFQPVLANGFVYMPGASGTVLRLDRETGQILERIGGTQPLDSSTFVCGPLAADSAGSVYYNAIALQRSSPWTTDVRDAWITRITPNSAVSVGHYANLVPQAPSAAAQCLAAFSDSELPWPPSPTAVPSSIPCGSQRPGLNVAPAIAPDGTIYTISRAHFNSRWTYLVALNSDLTPKWSASLRDRFNDGCNVLLPPNGTAGGCRSGALQGVDPSDNTAGAGRALDNSTSSPLIAPDASVFYGAYTRYNYTRGHLMHFSAGGAFLGSYPFGWDITPAIYTHTTGYSIVTKENHYDVGSYCDVCSDATRASDPSGYFVTRLDASLRVEWQVANPNGMEWCVNGPAIDRDGVAYINAEDGSLYSINPDGTLRQSILLTEALGQAYTPVAIDDNGRVYAEKAGLLLVVSSPARRRAVR
jgi:hypothetical protein